MDALPRTRKGISVFQRKQRVREDLLEMPFLEGVIAAGERIERRLESENRLNSALLSVNRRLQRRPHLSRQSNVHRCE
jgi:hypothetical protein